LYPCKVVDNRAAGGDALDSSSEDDLQPGCHVIRSPPPGELIVYLLIPIEQK
jgi:hypothetical protein